MFVTVLSCSGFAVGNLASKPLVVKDNDQFVKLELKKGESEEKNTILLEGMSIH